MPYQNKLCFAIDKKEQGQTKLVKIEAQHFKKDRSGLTSDVVVELLRAEVDAKAKLSKEPYDGDADVEDPDEEPIPFP